jgi:hypothetical protein
VLSDLVLVTVPIWSPLVKSLMVLAALFVLGPHCFETMFCNFLFLIILFACAGYMLDNAMTTTFYCSVFPEETFKGAGVVVPR